jgi:hypothetical protein
LNRVVLRVNDRIATLYDYEQRREEAQQQIFRREQDPQERQRFLARVGPQVFKEMYQDLLLESRADQLNIEVTPEQIEASLADTKQRVGIHSDEDFKAALQQWGLSEAQVREQVRANIRVQQVMREVNSRISLEEEDLRRYYRKNEEQFRQPEQLHLREVVVLEDGRVAAQGTHAELLEESPLYREIAEKGLPDQVFLTREDPEREVAGL